jgi:ribosomal-protein-alanine N-acetyltransferase
MNDADKIYRVRLAELTKEDLALQQEWFHDSGPETQTCRPLTNRGVNETWAIFQAKAKGGLFRAFSVKRVEDNRLVGRVTYFDLNRRNLAVEIGFLTGPQFRRQGYTAEAVDLLLKHLFDDLRLNKVMAQTAEFNTSAIALLAKLGFKQDGRLRQHHTLDDKLYDDLLFSILAEEYHGRKS